MSTWTRGDNSPAYQSHDTDVHPDGRISTHTRISRGLIGLALLNEPSHSLRDKNQDDCSLVDPKAENVPNTMFSICGR